MLHTINDNNISASISTLGAELQSLKNKVTREEYIWQGDENSWQGSAPILFPIVGRLKNGEYRFDNQTYQLNKHGFARTSEFNVIQSAESEISLMLTSDAQTKLSYPFDFEFVVTFKLDSSGLNVHYQVRNTGIGNLYFTLGSHPAFSLPLNECALEDYFIEFSSNETLDCFYLENNLLSDTPVNAYLNNQKIIPINKHLFDNDALIFKNIQSNKVHLKNRNTGLRLTMDTGNAPHFGLWAKPNAPFICFEPWYSFDDSVNASGDLTTKPGMIKLVEKAMFKTRYQLQIAP